MLVVRGVNIYPAAIEDILRGFAEIVEYRVEADSAGSLAELRIEIEPSPHCAEVAHLVGRIQAELQAVFGLRVDVASVRSGELPRFEMKARRWVRKID